MQAGSEISGEKSYWILWNQFYAQIGPIRFEQLIKAFGSAEKAWRAPAEQFSRFGWGPKELSLLKERENLLVEPILETIIKHKATVITREEDSYPDNLLQITAPPPLLYVRGELLPQDDLSLAVVGSRRATNYGKEVARALVPELASAGLTIVSGLALGIDAEAHRAALSVCGRKNAVLD